MELLFLEADEAGVKEVVIPLVIMIACLFIRWKLQTLGRHRGNPTGRSLWNVLAPGPWSEKGRSRYATNAFALRRSKAPAPSGVVSRRLTRGGVALQVFAITAIIGAFILLVLFPVPLAMTAFAVTSVGVVSVFYFISNFDPGWFRRRLDE